VIAARAIVIDAARHDREYATDLPCARRAVTETTER